MNWKNRLAGLASAAAVMALTGTRSLASSIELEGPSHSLAAPVTTAEFAEFFHSYKTLCLGLSGLCTLVGLVSFVRAVSKLSLSAGNEHKRAEAVKSLLISGVSLGLFGGISTVVGIFWNLL